MKLLSTLPVAALALSSSFAFANSDIRFEEGYLVVGDPKGDYSLKLDGRIMIDTGIVSSKLNPFVASTEVRRARLGFKTTLQNKWAAELDIDFAENDPEIKDLWVAYTGLEGFTFKVGNHKPFFSMEELTTSRWATFMETAMITDATAPGRRIGASVSFANNDIFAGFSVFGDEIGIDNTDPEGDGSEPGANEPYSYSGRFVYRPYVNADVSRFFHVGFNFMQLKPQSDDGGKMRLRNRVESRVLDYKLINTGKIKRVENLQSTGLELAGRYDKYSFQAEYIDNVLQRKEADDIDVDTSGYYVQGSYMIWGEGRPYNLHDGEFGPVHPSSTDGNLEIAVRYSTIDLNDIAADVFGGSADSITVGLNYYANSNLVFRLNHTRAELDQYADGDEDFIGGDTVNVTSLRIQYMF